MPELNRYNRFLIARNGDITKCEEMLAADDAWRRENASKFEGEFVLADVDGNALPFPILKLKLSLFTISSVDTITWDCVRALENALKRNEKVELIIDASNIGVTNINVSNVKSILQTFSDHYPERTYKVTITGLSFVYYYIVKAIISFLDSRTAAKISLK